MNILIDVDGIIADLVGDMCNELNRQGLGPITPGDFTRYDFSATLNEHQMKAAEEWMSEPGTCASLRWYLGAHDFLTRLGKLGTVYAVTAPHRGSPTWAAERVRWLRKHIPADHVLSVPSRAKKMVRGDVFIEDNSATAHEWAWEQGGITCVLARPWNRPDGDVEYCDSYDSIIRAVSR